MALWLGKYQQSCKQTSMAKERRECPNAGGRTRFERKRAGTLLGQRWGGGEEVFQRRLFPEKRRGFSIAAIGCQLQRAGGMGEKDFFCPMHVLNSQWTFSPSKYGVKDLHCSQLHF